MFFVFRYFSKIFETKIQEPHADYWLIVFVAVLIRQLHTILEKSTFCQKMLNTWWAQTTQRFLPKWFREVIVKISLNSSHFVTSYHFCGTHSKNYTYEQKGLITWIKKVLPDAWFFGEIFWRFFQPNERCIPLIKRRFHQKVYPIDASHAITKYVTNGTEKTFGFIKLFLLKTSQGKIFEHIHTVNYDISVHVLKN